MKKIIMVFMCFFLVGCGQKKELFYNLELLETKLQGLFDKADVISLEDLKERYAIDTENMEEGLIFVPKTADHADMLFIIKANEGRQAEVKQALDSLFESFLLQYELYYPEEYQKLKEKKVEEKDGYFIYSVSNTQKKVFEIIEAYH